MRLICSGAGGKLPPRRAPGAPQHFDRDMNQESVARYKARPLDERMALALRETLSAEERRIILREEQWMQVRVYFARRADLSVDEVEYLLDDQDHVIRLCVAKRDDLTPVQVERCVGDRDPNVRYFIARNPLLDEAQRGRLAADEDPLVRRAVRKGPRPVQFRQREGQARLIR